MATGKKPKVKSVPPPVEDPMAGKEVSPEQARAMRPDPEPDPEFVYRSVVVQVSMAHAARLQAKATQQGMLLEDLMRTALVDLAPPPAKSDEPTQVRFAPGTLEQFD